MAADDAAALFGRPSLYELADIERERWLIVAIDLDSEEHATHVTVYALDRQVLHTHGLADVKDLQETLGELPVTPFQVPADHVEAFVRHAFRTVSIRLVSADIAPDRLVVTPAT